MTSFILLLSEVDSPNMFIIYQNFKNHIFVIQTAVRMRFWPNDAENFKEFCCKSNLLQPAGYVLYHYLSICFNESCHFEYIMQFNMAEQFSYIFSSLSSIFLSFWRPLPKKKNISFFVGSSFSKIHLGWFYCQDPNIVSIRSLVN